MLLFGSITFVLHSGKFFHIYRPHRDGLLVAGPFVTDYPPPPSWEKIPPPVEDLGLCDPLGEPGWLSW